MPKLYVYLYENGKRLPFSQLSGQESQSIGDAVDMYGDLDTDPLWDSETPTDYATMEVSDEDASKLIGKKEIKPRQYGLHKWGKVELEFRTTPDNLRSEIQKGVEKREQRVAIDEALEDKLPPELRREIKGYAVGKGRKRKTRKTKKSRKMRKTRGRK